MAQGLCSVFPRERLCIVFGARWRSCAHDLASVVCLWCQRGSVCAGASLGCLWNVSLWFLVWLQEDAPWQTPRLPAHRSTNWCLS